MEEHKILGVPWNPESDQLIFDVTDLAKAALDLLSETLSVLSAGSTIRLDFSLQ